MLNTQDLLDSNQSLSSFGNWTVDNFPWKHSSELGSDLIDLDTLRSSGSSQDSLVFIDPTVENYQYLATKIQPGKEAIVLDPSRDGIAQITEVLSQYENVNSIHIVSHGAPGNLQLGNTSLSLNNLERYSSQLRNWSDALTPDADILFFGCNVAAGEQGLNFVQQLSYLTGVDVAASTNLTGSAALGGDWTLEVATGTIESALPFPAQTMDYDAVLASGSFTVDPNSYTVNEASGSIDISVLRTGGSDGTASIDYTTVNETATAGSDYTTASGTLNFNSGETSKSVSVPILQDSANEGGETFGFGIQRPVGANLGTQRTARVTIIDDDSTDLTISQPSVNENTGQVEIQVTRGGDTRRRARVNYATSDGTARAREDYTATSGRLQFNRNESTKTISVPILNNDVGEPNETFNVNFTNPNGGITLGTQNRSVVTILDDDPGSFATDTVVSGLTAPTAFDWTPDNNRMYIAEKGGVVRVSENGTLLSTPFINLASEVNSASDRGLLGIAVHPNFPSQPYVYLLYTYDPPEVNNNVNPNTDLDDPDGNGNRPSRLVRVTADASTNYTTAVAGSEVVILGRNSTWQNTSRPDANSTNDTSIPPSGINPDGSNLQDYLATDSQSHSIGTVRFGTDGSLFVSNGDGTSYNSVDPRTRRVQDLDNLSGKILRIDPITGAGLSDNPFYNGDSNSNRSKVYNYGMRNPFRFTIDRETNTPYVGDVGWTQWEEVNTGRGQNFGWPWFEGGNGQSLRTGGYSELPEAQAFYNSGQSVTPAIYARNHSEGARAIVMGDFYTGTTFPGVYDGALFFADVNEGTVNALTFDQLGNVESVRQFATGLPGIVQMETGADSNLYFTNVGTGEISRWRPVADANASTTPSISARRITNQGVSLFVEEGL